MKNNINRICQRLSIVITLLVFNCYCQQVNVSRLQTGASSVQTGATYLVTAANQTSLAATNAINNFNLPDVNVPINNIKAACGTDNANQNNVTTVQTNTVANQINTSISELESLAKTIAQDSTNFNECLKEFNTIDNFSGLCVNIANNLYNNQTQYVSTIVSLGNKINLGSLVLEISSNSTKQGIPVKVVTNWNAVAAYVQNLKNNQSSLQQYIQNLSIGTTASNAVNCAQTVTTNVTDFVTKLVASITSGLVSLALLGATIKSLRPNTTEKIDGKKTGEESKSLEEQRRLEEEAEKASNEIDDSSLSEVNENIKAAEAVSAKKTSAESKIQEMLTKSKEVQAKQAERESELKEEAEIREEAKAEGARE